MQVLIVFLAVAVIGLAALVAAGRFGEQQTEPVRDVYRPPVDEEQMHGDDLRQVRFGISPMGYDICDVDEWMARLARELDRRDGVVAASPDDPGTAAPAASLPEAARDAE